MALIILLVLIAIPIVELSLLISIGGSIGGGSVVLLCILTAAVGLSLVRAQGIQVMARMRAQMQAGEPFGEQMIHGFFLLLAGLMLMFPGFMTDAVGGLLLVPYVRLLLGKAGLASIVLGAHQRQSRSHTGDRDGMDSDDATIVDIDGVEIQPERQTLSTHQTKDTNKDTTG